MKRKVGGQAWGGRLRSAVKLILGAPLLCCLFVVFVGGEVGQGQPRAPGTQVPANDAGRKQLRDAIQKLLQPEPTETPEEENASRGPRRLEDQRAPVDQQTWDQLDQIRKDLSEKKEKEALSNLQKLFERSDDSLYLAGKENWISTRDEGIRLFGTLSLETRKQYEVQYGGLARQKLEQAITAIGPQELAQVALRYLFTAAGQEAANRLASWHMDHEEYAAARVWLERLSQVNAEICRTPLWKLKALRVAVATADEEWRGKLLAELQKIPPDQLRLGEERVDLSTRSKAVPIRVTPELVQGWPVFYGNEMRNAVQPAGTPWLRSQWSLPFAGSELVQKVTQEVWKDLQDRRIGGLPAVQPLVVGDRLIVRNWQGVQVIQASTGKRLWEARDRISPEEILLALHRSWLTQLQSDGNEDDHRDPLGWTSISLGQQIWQGSGGEFSPIAHFLFRDYNYGVQSSDGERLFVLQEQPVLMTGQPRQGNGGEESSDKDPFGRHWSSNHLAAYDLASGRRLWDVGGVSEEIDFESPLAGWFFLGAPISSDGELLCVAEKKGELRLLGLDPVHGELRWSQLLGYAEAKIGEDPGRQWLSVQPTMVEGLIVCPLMTGWIVAIDRLTHSLVWTVRTRPAQKNEPGNSGLMPTGLNERWALSPVVVAGNRLICAPPEGGNLLCLSTSTGKTLWSKPRGAGLFIAGVHEESVIVVGRSEVRGYHLANGESWQYLCPDKTYVTGRGIITAGGVLQLPVNGGELLCLSLREHTLQSRLRLMGTADQAGVVPLGNLVRCGETWCSAHPLGIQAFESQEVLEAEGKRQPAVPTAEWIQKQALWLSMRGENQKAWELLSRSQPENSSPGQKEQAWLKGEILSRLLGAEETNTNSEENRRLEDQALAWLKTTGQPALRLQVRGALGRRWSSKGEALKAFNLLWNGESEFQLAGDDQNAVWMTFPGDVQTLRGDVWLGRELHEVWNRAGEKERKSLSARIEEVLTDETSVTLAGRQRKLRMLAFHPASLPFRWKLSEEYASRKEWSSAEVLLREVLPLMPEREVEIYERLVSLRIQAGRPVDAVRALNEVQERSPESKTSRGETFADWQAALTREGKIPAAEFVSAQRSFSELKMFKEGVHGELIPEEEIPIPANANPSWRSLMLQVSAVEQRLILRNARTNQIEWSVPLRSRTEGNENLSCQIEGDRLYVLFRGMLHALAPFERRALWVRNVEAGVSVQDEYVRPDGGNARILVPLSKSVLSRRLVDDVWREPLQSLGAGLLMFRHRRSLEVLDAERGETLWMLEGISSDMEFRGDGAYLYQFSVVSKTPQVRAARDGGLREVPRLQDELRSTLQFSGHRLIRYGHMGLEGNPQSWSLSSYDPVSRKVTWEHKFGNEEPLVASLSEDSLLVKREGEELELIDLQTGNAKRLGKMELPTNSRRNPSLVAFRDWERVYIAANRGGNRTIFQDGLPVTEVNGMLFTFAVNGKGLLWKKEFRGVRNGWDREGGGYGVILERLNDSGVLLFSRREFERRNGKDDLGVWTQRLVAVDKLSGRELLRTTVVPASGFRSMTVNPAEGMFELRGYDQRVRLVPAPVKAEGSVPDSGKKPMTPVAVPAK